MIVEAISTESTLFIRQNQLLHRFVGNYSLLPLRVRPSGNTPSPPRRTFYHRSRSHPVPVSPPSSWAVRPAASWEQVLRSVCVSGLVPVFMPFHGREYFYIMGGGWHKGTLYRAEVYGQSTICVFVTDFFVVVEDCHFPLKIKKRGVLVSAPPATCWFLQMDL